MKGFTFTILLSRASCARTPYLSPILEGRVPGTEETKPRTFVSAEWGGWDISFSFLSGLKARRFANRRCVAQTFWKCPRTRSRREGRGPAALRSMAKATQRIKSCSTSYFCSWSPFRSHSSSYSFSFPYVRATRQPVNRRLKGHQDQSPGGGSMTFMISLGLAAGRTGTIVLIKSPEFLNRSPTGVDIVSHTVFGDVRSPQSPVV